MKTRMLKLNDLWNLDVIMDAQYNLFYIWYDDYDLQSNPVFPVIHDIVGDDYSSHDIDYFGNNSNEKYLSPLVVKMVKRICETLSIDFNSLLDGTITNTDRETIIANLFDNSATGYKLQRLIYNRFSTKWKKIWDALNTTYKPLENYAMKEKRTPNLTTSGNGSSDADASIYGFNSTEPNDSSKSHGESESSQTITGTDETERTGNIGVTTSQQMLESEFEVRKYDFFKEMFKDIDSILCLKCY